MIRVLHCVGKMDVGGIETLLMNIYRNIDRSKIQFDFFTNSMSEGFYDSEIRNLGGEIYYSVNRRESYKKYKNDFKNALLKGNYNCVHVHVSSMTNIDMLKISKKMNISSRIIHCHNTKGPNKLLHKLSHLFNRSIINKYATKKFACSREAALWGYKKIKDVIIFRNAIEVKKFHYDEVKRNEIRKKLNIENDEKVIGHVGRFVEQKNHKKIIRIFKELNDKNPSTKLLLIGDGPLKNRIKEQAKKLNILNKVIILDPIKEVHEYYQAMDLFLFPSLFEGLGMVAVEAQISNLPVLASNNVPLEAKICNEFIALDLEDNDLIWSDYIHEIITNNTRENNYELAFEKGYDISKNSKWIENFYIKNK